MGLSVSVATFLMILKKHPQPNTPIKYYDTRIYHAAYAGLTNYTATITKTNSPTTT
jgi:hypothetical protein